MVLKRLFVTALSALGLGALAAGQAFAQGNGLEGMGGIPAPKLYGDITSCAGGTLPTASTAMGMASLLGMGGLVDQALDDAPTTADAVINATETTGLTGLLTFGTGCDNPIVDGYDTAVDLYTEYGRAKKALPAADATPDADATAAYNKAKKDKDDYAGDVYNEVYNQRMKLDAADKAIKDYNALVGNTGNLAKLKDNVDDQGTGQSGGYDDIVANDFGVRVDDQNNALTGDDLIASVAKAYGKDQVAGYRAIRGNDTADDSGAVDITSRDTNAFDAAGALHYASEAQNATTLTKASGNVTTLGTIAHELQRWETAVELYEGELEDAKDAGNLNTALQEENLRRAKAGRDHVQSELNRLTGVVRAQNRDIDQSIQVTIGTGDSAKTYTSERDLVNAYADAQSAVDTAASGVRTAVKALDDANKALKAKAGGADSYLNQLVTLREFQQAAAQKAVDDAGSDPAQSLEDALETAKENTEAAKTQRTSHQNLTANPDAPASQLLSALLETDEKKADDGLALVSAVSDTYDAAKNAEDTANKVANDVAGLTGDGGAVAMNTADIATNKGMIATNTADIATNKTAIAANTADIATNKGMIMTNTADIATNKGMIATNMAGIATNKGMIDTNTASIGTNTSAIADNANAIGSNSSAIQRNSGMIGELSESLETVRAGVAASMALAGMPAINGRGISIGVGSFDGESAFAVGFMIQGEMASFKVGVTSAGGATGASAGVGFQF